MSWVKTGCFSQFSEVLLEHFKVGFVFVLFCFQKIPFYITGKKNYVGWNTALARYINSSYFHQRNRDIGETEIAFQDQKTSLPSEHMLLSLP